jgi:hypothetical protein
MSQEKIYLTPIRRGANGVPNTRGRMMVVREHFVPIGRVSIGNRGGPASGVRPVIDAVDYAYQLGRNGSMKPIRQRGHKRNKEMK